MSLIRTILTLCTLPLPALPATAVDFRDPELFRPELFPELQEMPDSEVLLRGLNALFPERIFHGSPDEKEPAEPRPPLVKEVSENVVYVRAYDLNEVLPALRENLERPVMILDLRFVESDLSSSLALGAALTRRNAFHIYAVGDYPLPETAEEGRIGVEGAGLRDRDHTLLTLTNQDTGGPVEVVLEQLRRDAEIISIGARSAGRTGSFRPVPDFPEWQVLSGELRPHPEVSLVDTGFVPRVEVEVEPEEERAAYLRLTDETDLDEVVQTQLRREPADRRRPRLPSPPVTPEEETEPAEAPPPDLVLQRAVNIVKALQALGQIPG